MIGARTKETLDEVAADLEARGGNIHAYQCDFSDMEDCDRFVKTVLDNHGHVDVLVNNAAIIFHSTIMDTSEEDFMKIVSINQLGVFLGMQSVFESMKANGGGSIINVSSIDGLQSKNSLIAYSSTKWAVRGMTKSAALEMGKYGIRVNSVHPGGVYTAMHGSDFITVDQANEFYKTQALPRVGLPKEIAAVTIFLASDEATYSTGSEFIADGGWNAGLINESLPQL